MDFETVFHPEDSLYSMPSTQELCLSDGEHELLKEMYAIDTCDKGSQLAMHQNSQQDIKKELDENCTSLFSYKSVPEYSMVSSARAASKQQKAMANDAAYQLPSFIPNTFLLKEGVSWKRSKNMQQQTTYAAATSGKERCKNEKVNYDAILNVPITMLSKEEKKLRRRAQVAISARKHRNRQKQELIELRKHVQMLQKQMADLRLASSSKHKRHRIIEPDASMPEKDLRSTFLNFSQTKSKGEIKQIKHPFDRLPTDPSERRRYMRDFCTRRQRLAVKYQQDEFGGKQISTPHIALFLYNEPSWQFKFIRVNRIVGLECSKVVEGMWDSICNFNVEVPLWTNNCVQLERIEEVDDNIRYGRVVAPLCTCPETQEIIYTNSLVMFSKFELANAVMIQSGTVYHDDLNVMPSSPNCVPCSIVGSISIVADKDEYGNDVVDIHVLYDCIPDLGAVKMAHFQIAQAFTTYICHQSDIYQRSLELKLTEILNRSNRLKQ